MAREENKRDMRIQHYVSTPEDDERAGRKRCATCGRIIVIGDECMKCAIEHPGTAAAGWAKWGIRKILGGK